MRRIQALLLATAGLVTTPASAVARPDSSTTDVFEKLEWSTSKGRLGVTVMSLSPELRTYFGSLDKTGVLVSRVEPGSPAALAGIAVGDVVVSVRGTKIDDAADVLSALSGVGKDERVQVKVLRDHKPVTFDVTLTQSTSALELPPMSWLRRLLEEGSVSHSHCT